MGAPGGSAKSVVQIALIEWRCRFDHTFGFVDPKKRNLYFGRQRCETNRDRVASRREDHQTLDLLASAAKFFQPYQASRKYRVNIWLQFAIANADSGEQLFVVFN
jgi:hypothetical protein